MAIFRRRQLPIVFLAIFALIIASYYSDYFPSSSYSSLAEQDDQVSFTLPHPLVRSAKARLKDAVKVRELRVRLLEVHKPDDEHHQIKWTTSQLDRLADCLESDTCGPGEETVVVLGSFHFGMAYLGMISGEDIWASSTLSALTSLNTTRLYLPDANLVHLAYTHIPHLIQLIIWEGEQLQYCLNKSEGQIHPDRALSKCIKREGYTDGIPIWKGVVFHFWNSPASPLGGGWTISPEYYGEVENGSNRYLGYSIERECMTRPSFSTSQRSHRALLLGKRLDYFQPPKMAFLGSLKAAAAAIAPIIDRTTGTKLPFRFASTVNVDGKPAESGFPEWEVVDFLPPVQHAAWFEELGKSKVMVGVGWPEWSPSPYDALCMGVPFINVIKGHDTNHPEDRSRWMTQHNGLRDLDPPYVYHIHQGQGEELVSAVKSAVNSPIERYIPERMTYKSVLQRHKNLLELDWKAEAAKVWDKKSLKTVDGIALLL